MRNVITVALLALAALPVLAAPASAQEAQTPPAAATVFHPPVAEAPGGAPLELHASITEDWRLEGVYARLRPLGSHDPWVEVPFERLAAASFVAVVPARLVQPPGLEYWIVARDPQGQEIARFASDDAPHPVLVTGETPELHQQERLARHRGHRSSFEARSQYTRYGASLADGPSGEEVLTDPGSDNFWVGELEYTYRWLTFLYDISFGVGVMRGHYATLTQGGQTTPCCGASAQDAPGLNYGYGGATLELHRAFSIAGRLTLGASEEGFAAGIGGLIRIGQIAGTRLELGGDLMQDAGNRGWMRFAWNTVPYVPMALSFEVNGWPDADLNTLGSRLIYEAGVELAPSFTLLAHVGRATRAQAAEAGWVGGVSARYEF